MQGRKTGVMQWQLAVNPGNKRVQRTSVYTMSERSLKACLQER